MYAVDDVETATVSLRMEPGESMTEFAARVAQAHGPLSQAEIAKLRKVFAPTAPKQTTAATSVATEIAA